MAKIRVRSEDIQHFILDNVENHPENINKVTSAHFSISRQAVNKHLRKLITDAMIVETGNTRNKIYSLATIVEWTNHYDITPELAEDVVWRNDVRSILGELSANAVDIWEYGFTEMFNNAKDHSEGTTIAVSIKKTITNTEIVIFDNGLGIFKRIQSRLNLLDERHAILELSKGKLTTDPQNHTGEGIFFSSRMFDSYAILSGGVYFSHHIEAVEDWIFENSQFIDGTCVWMKLNNHTPRTSKDIFDKFAPEDEDYGFNKTIVPVKLAQYDNDKLVSRSQAKRLLSRVERFTTVIFDFNDIEAIGQAFADEIFRVFAKQHPDIKLIPLNANTAVTQMINRAINR